MHADTHIYSISVQYTLKTHLNAAVLVPDQKTVALSCIQSHQFVFSPRESDRYVTIRLSPCILKNKQTDTS